MAANDDLGDLIVKLNPYANNKEPHRGAITGPVDIYLRKAPSWPPETATYTALGQPTGGQAEVQVEMESNYPAEWTFKGQPQKVYKTVRIKYRYPVLEDPGDKAAKPVVKYWVEDYMLIGFEGGPG